MNDGSRRRRGWRVATSALAARGTWRSPSAVTIVTSFSDVSKPMPERADVVDDDGVEPLALELPAAVLDRAVARLGGEADEQLAGAAAGGETGEHVIGTLEPQLEFLAGLGPS